MLVFEGENALRMIIEHLQSELADDLARLTLDDTWTDDDARRLWKSNLANGSPSPAASEPTVTPDVAY